MRIGPTVFLHHKYRQVKNIALVKTGIPEAAVGLNRPDPRRVLNSRFYVKKLYVLKV